MIDVKFKCPICKQEYKFKICDGLDLLNSSYKMRLLNVENNKDFHDCISKQLQKYIKFDCGCIFKFKQIDFDENHNCKNIIFTN